MPVMIEGHEFTLFADRDRVNLAKLSFEGRVDWFELRFQRMLVEPLERIRPTNCGSTEDDLWSLLVFGSVLFNGVEALGSFCSLDTRNRSRFDAFVKAFMDQTYHAHLDPLWGFRNSLAHGLTVEQGRFEFLGGVPLQVHPNDGEIEIDPDALLEDFKRALQTFLRDLRVAQPTSSMRVNFEKRFQENYKVPPCPTSRPQP